jgi:SAM-dependent methyltransferase
MRPAPVQILSAEKLLQEVHGAGKVLDVGSGGRRLARHVTTTDIVARANVDVVADVCQRLPFADGEFDLVVCTSVLEHVADSIKAMKELRRVIRPGGRLWLEIPFIYHFHVSEAGDTADYWRWTWQGCLRLMEGFRVLSHGHNVGPGTALRLLAAEVLAMPFFWERHQGFYYLARWALGWLCYPLGWLDRLCMRKPISHRATGGFWILAQREP